MSCTGTMPCPNTTDRRITYTDLNPCEYYRKLCVTCSQENGEVYIRVQGNSLPNHCSDSKVNTAVDINVDWKVKFNPDVTGVMNYSESDVNTQEDTTDLLCDIQRTSYDKMLS